MHEPPHVMLPADTRYLEALRLAASISVENAGGSGSTLTDVVLAVDEVAAILMQVAARGSRLEMTCRRDDEDLYIRLAVPIEDRVAPPEPEELTRQLLATTTDSFHLTVDQGRLVGVLQTELDDPG
jgi:hypothetical protein